MMKSTTENRGSKRGSLLSPRLHSPHQQARNKCDLKTDHAFAAGATDEPLRSSVEPDALAGGHGQITAQVCVCV